MPLLSSALIDVAYFFQMYDDDTLSEDSEDVLMLESIINSVSTTFEEYCGRVLKARDFSWDSTDTTIYSTDWLHYCIFDPPPHTFFFFPTYPVNTLTQFMLNGVVVTVAPEADYSAINGYLLDRSSGKLTYDQGFSFGYLQNIKAKWNGGYKAESREMAELQYLCFKAVEGVLKQPKNANTIIQSEKIGSYQYSLYSPTIQKQLQGLSPSVISSLSRYKRIAV